MHQVDNMTLTQVWDKSPCGSVWGYTTNYISIIGVYIPLVFRMRSGFRSYLFITLCV